VSSPDNHRPLWPAYTSESLESVGTTLLSVSIFFWTTKYLGWTLQQNFLLAVGQGIVYTTGALCAEKVASRFGRRRALVAIYLCLAAIALGAAFAPNPVLLVGLLLAYSFVAAANWPMLESLVSSEAPDAHALSMRVGIYNLVWSGSNTITIAVSGTIIDSTRPGIFLIAAAVNVISAIVIGSQHRIDPGTNAARPPAHAEPEPELLRSRTLAMWLARIALPSTYVVIYSMAAMMPALPIIRGLSTAESTLLSSVWMAARFVTFLVLGFTVWWHTRPKLLLISTIIMLIAFLGVTIPPSGFTHAGYSADLASMILWQILLGIAIGIIYSGSLYFGMVLSHGATEHGGYHEALIGLGSILGPGAGALTQTFSQATSAGKTPYVSILAVSTVISLTILAAFLATLRAAHRTPT
jgi:MFS family permease